MIVKANAKVNVTLEVLGKRSDGYHDLRSVVVPVSLADEIELVPAEKTVLEIADEKGFLRGVDCGGEKNLAVKAVRLMQQTFGIEEEVSLKIVKNIPCGGGLGGGSADAAAVMNALNSLWKIGAPKSDLATLGAKLGSDIPALVLGGMVLMEGRGERVSSLLEGCGNSFALVLSNPGIFCSTPEIFGSFEKGLSNEGDILYNMISSIASGDFKQVASALNNDLARTAYARYPEIAESAQRLKDAGCEGVSMSGSGATVFGIVRDEAQARETMERAASSNWIEFARTCPVV